MKRIYWIGVMGFLRATLATGIAVTLIALMALPASAADPPAKQWDKTFGGTGEEWATSVQQTSDGGYIFAAKTTSFGNGFRDLWLVKTDASGNKQWDTTFGGPGEEMAYSVQQTTDGGYIMAGSTDSFGTGGYDFYLVKTDSSGNKQWDKTFGGTSNDVAYSVRQTSDGGFIMAGNTHSYGAGEDVWLIKTDSSGNMTWDKTFGGAKNDWANSVQPTSDGGYIIAGVTEPPGTGQYLYDFWLIKTDSSGNLEWDKTFGGADRDEALSVLPTSDGGYLLTGFTYSFGAGGYDAWVVKTDSVGNMTWSQVFGGAGGDGFASAQPTSNGGYIFAGGTQSFGAGGHDVWLVKTDSSGNQQWDKTFGGTSDDAASSIQPTSDGGYIVAGDTYSYSAGVNDAWLIKLAPENQPPAQPSNLLPANGATGISLTPSLFSSSFADPDTGDTHLASQWQIRTSTGSYASPVFDSGTDTSHLTIITVPSGALDYSATYYWKVRHQDNHGAWSGYSSETSFTIVVGDGGGGGGDTGGTRAGRRSLPDPSSFAMVGGGLAAGLFYVGLSRLRRRLSRS